MFNNKKYRMTRIFTLLSLALIMFSCSNEFLSERTNAEETKSISLTVATGFENGDDTRVSVENSSINDSAWKVVWDEGDVLGAWVNSDNSIVPFSMSDYDATASKFQGEVGVNAQNIRLFYPYNSDVTATSTSYPISLASQTSDLSSNLYLVSDSLINVEGVEEFELTSMKHIGAYVVLSASFKNVSADYTLSSVEMLNVPTSVNINTSKSVNDSDFYGTTTTGTIKVSDLGLSVVDGGDTQQVYFTIFPFEVASGSSLQFKFNFLSKGVGYTTTVTKTNSGSDISFERATYNTINVECDCSNMTIVQDGTAEGPYLLYSAANIKAINNSVEALSAHYTLMNDVNLNGSSSSKWSPLGKGKSDEQIFLGVFDGQNHTISGLYIDSTADYKGLFGYVSSSAVIKNLIVEGQVKTSASFAAGIAGYVENTSSDSEPNVIMNCINRATVTAAYYAGGIVGKFTYPGNIINCGNEGTITATSYYAGGICGYTHCSEVVNCYNTAKVSGAGMYLGGLVSNNTSASSLLNSYNAGNVTTSNSNVRIASVVCINSGTCKIIDCYWNSTVFTGEYSIFTNSNNTESDTVISGLTTAEMQSADFVTKLNETAAELNSTSYNNTLCAWEYNEGGYPTLNTEAIATK